MTTQQEQTIAARLAWKAAKREADTQYARDIEPTRAKHEAAKQKARAKQRAAHATAGEQYRANLQQIANRWSG